MDWLNEIQSNLGINCGTVVELTLGNYFWVRVPCSQSKGLSQSTMLERSFEE